MVGGSGKGHQQTLGGGSLTETMAMVSRVQRYTSVYQNLAKRTLQMCAVRQLHLDKAARKKLFQKQFVSVPV